MELSSLQMHSHRVLTLEFLQRKQNKKYNFSVFTFKTPSLHQLQGQFLIFNIGPDALLTSDPAVN